MGILPIDNPIIHCMLYCILAHYPTGLSVSANLSPIIAQRKNRKKMKKILKKKGASMNGKIKTIKCEECQDETTNYYPVFTNKGRAYKCAECYENGIRRGTRIYQLTSNKNNYEK